MSKARSATTPHPDAILYRHVDGATMPWPNTGRVRTDNEDLADAKKMGYAPHVPVMKTGSGRLVHITIEPQCGGLNGLNRVLTAQRTVGQGNAAKQIPAHMLVSEYERLPEGEKAALKTVARRAVDPRDAKIAALEAQLAAANRPVEAPPVAPARAR